MALKLKVKTKEEVPAEQAGLYVERDGEWVLDVEGAVDPASVEELRRASKTRLDEFRNTNAALMRERDELKRRFERSESEQVRAIAAERDSLNARLTAIQIDQGVTTTATKRGLRPTAIPDITARARSVFRLVEGAPRAYEADGQTVRVGKDGMTPMTLEEWVDLQVGEAPHLFESNAGGGAAGDASGGGAGTRATRSVRNPFRKDTWNLTEQMRLLKSDPGLAARLKARNPRSKLNVQSRMFKHSTRAGTTSFWPRPCPPRNPRSKLNVQSWMFDVRQKSSSTRFHFNPCRDHFLLAPPVSAA